MWRSENSIQESVLSLLHVGFRDQTHTAGLGSNHLLPIEPSVFVLCVWKIFACMCACVPHARSAKGARKRDQIL